MDTRSDFVDADLHILTLDIPDDALERAAGAELAFTLVHCSFQPPKQPRRKLSKAELREQAAAAFLAWRAGQTPENK